MSTELIGVFSAYVPTKRKCTVGSYAKSEGPDQTARMRSLIRAFAVHKQNQRVV